MKLRCIYKNFTPSRVFTKQSVVGLGIGFIGMRGVKSVLWVLGCLQVLAVPLVLLIFSLMPQDGSTRFLVFYPQSWTQGEQMAAVIAAHAQPLSVEWHGGWVIETSSTSAAEDLKEVGALFVLNGENLGICGTA